MSLLQRPGSVLLLRWPPPLARPSRRGGLAFRAQAVVAVDGGGGRGAGARRRSWAAQRQLGGALVRRLAWSHRAPHPASSRARAPGALRAPGLPQVDPDRPTEGRAAPRREAPPAAAGRRRQKCALSLSLHFAPAAPQPTPPGRRLRRTVPAARTRRARYLALTSSGGGALLEPPADPTEEAPRRVPPAPTYQLTELTELAELHHLLAVCCVVIVSVLRNRCYV